MKRPNRTTRATFAKTDAGEDIHRAKDADEMFRELETPESTHRPGGRRADDAR